jgi:hypothetical protein
MRISRNARDLPPSRRLFGKENADAGYDKSSTPEKRETLEIAPRFPRVQGACALNRERGSPDRVSLRYVARSFRSGIVRAILMRCGYRTRQPTPP